MKKDYKKCPECGAELIKKTKQAEGVRSCPKCGSVWLIILIRKNKNEEG